ncbi:MAG: nucleotide exchange factor GrpE [Gammaproteobacteria bacterium]|nr:nucleotide exchange factor GrpE [Gammaproteobacteria bacterium]MBL6818980.1 nucleotide exchange factor GrpE [Gammaproteobacteria bacterium]MBL6898963.1 nucleotide exchange factor GrpE [Gammaproteobacteria bacterium]
MSDNNNLENQDKSEEQLTEVNDESASQAEEPVEKSLEEKYSETYDALLRAKAEVENIKKRSEKEISNAYKFSTEGVFLDLIPIFESLDIAVTQDSKNITLESLQEGNKLLKNMFDSFLEKNSLEVINPTDQKFDPNLHQAIKTVKNKKKENNTIDEVLQKGYKLLDRVIKPALVVVVKN